MADITGTVTATMDPPSGVASSQGGTTVQGLGPGKCTNPPSIIPGLPLPGDLLATDIDVLTSQSPEPLEGTEEQSCEVIFTLVDGGQGTAWYFGSVGWEAINNPFSDSGSSSDLSQNTVGVNLTYVPLAEPNPPNEPTDYEFTLYLLGDTQELIDAGYTLQKDGATIDARTYPCVLIVKDPVCEIGRKTTG